MEEELLAQPRVIKLLDSLREQYTRYQELCRQRNKRTQLDEIHTKVMQVCPRWALHAHSECHYYGRSKEEEVNASKALPVLVLWDYSQKSFFICEELAMMVGISATYVA